MEANRDLAVGVIGLGNMGSGVAARLVEVGFPVLGFDISEERNNQAAGKGIVIAEGVADVARRASRLICLVDTSAQVERVVSDVAFVAGGGDIFICMSTVDLVTIQKSCDELSKVGWVLVDAPSAAALWRHRREIYR